MARFRYCLVDGFTVCSVPARVIEHVQIGRRSQNGLLGIFENFTSIVFIFFNNDPLRVSGEWVESKLELALCRPGAHGSDGSGSRESKGEKVPTGTSS